MKFAGWDAAHPNIARLALAGLFAPRHANLSGKLGDIFVVLKIGPKFYLRTRLLFYYFTDYGDGWSDMSPGSAPDC